MSYLGAGFRLALKDLEIRGAGNLLGAEQSGHIHAIGFDLYMEMLEKSVAELKGLKIEEEFETSIGLKVNAFIPETYIDDITLRLSLYRRIGSARTADEITSVESEMKDRFGLMPEEVMNLLSIMRLKIMARELLVTKIQDNRGLVSVIFSPATGIEPKNIFELRDKTNGKMRFLPDGFEIDMRGLSWLEVYGNLSKIMSELSKAPSLLV
jgi:transcription-repair coupling factor (superfamily II helicase)